MKKLRSPMLLTLLAGILISPAIFAEAIGVSLGLNGAAINLQVPVSEKLSARFVYADMKPISSAALDKAMEDVDIDDIKYNVEWEKKQLGVLMDYYPFAGRFHLTGGIYAGDHNWIMESSVDDQTFEVGDKTYSSTDLSIRGEVKFAKASPYLGIGFGNKISGSVFTFNLDIGVLYLGQPTVNADATGTVCISSCDQDSSQWVTFDVATFAEFQGNMEKERANLQSEIEDFGGIAKFLPIIQFGLAFKF